MATISVQQKRKLKSLAHHVKPVIYIGKNGISESLIAACDKALSDHELIKAKFIDFKDEKKSLIDTLTEQTGSVLVSITGNIAVLFRQNENPTQRKIVI